jgi:hypothetical protein
LPSSATNKYRPDGTLRSDLLNDPTMPTRIWTKPGFNWCIGQLATSNVANVQADPDIRVLPDAALDLTWGSINTNIRNQAINAFQNAGFTTTGISTSMAVREVLLYIVQQIQAGIGSVEQGDVRDPT